ncbi:MAG: AlpA family phage regulatory protein [Terracidiphilus sp.]|jgi:predicted DNA-binding transcriptional regulator AlpA
MYDSPHPTELLSLGQVEERTGMGKSNIYRLIGLGLFPAPIHLGGSKWDAGEVEEYILRHKDERDRQRGQSKFTPRPSILSGLSTGVRDESLSDHWPGSGLINSPSSTVRILAPEIVDALRTLGVAIPELYLDRSAWTVSLAVVKIAPPSAEPTKRECRHRKQKNTAMRCD